MFGISSQRPLLRSSATDPSASGVPLSSTSPVLSGGAHTPGGQQRSRRDHGHGHPDSDKFERFERWLRDSGAEFEALELRDYDAGDVGDDLLANRADADNGDDEDDDEEKKDPGPPPPAKDASFSSQQGEDGNRNGQSQQAQQGEGAESSEMRGVHARSSIAPNTVCVAIPRKCLITVEMGQATSIGRSILESDLDLDAPKHIFLMVYLLWDRKVNGDRSFFKPYYDILPRTLRNMPVFWSDKELAYLEGSYLLAQISDRNDAITDDYRSICEVSPELAKLATLNEFKWARMCVCSRNFGLQVDGRRTSALVPYADMLNHYRPRETKWTYDEERGAFTITALQSIPSGSQVYDSYGQKCNHRFLLNYGFAIEDNREVDGFCPNEVPLELAVRADDPNYSAKLEFWTRGEQGHGHHKGLLTGDSAAVHGSMEALAAAVTAGATTERLKAAGSTASLDPAAAAAAAVSSALEAVAVAVEGRRIPAALDASPPVGRSRSLDAAEVINVVPATAAAGVDDDCRASAIPMTRRVRICVSNNENTRSLFSMLRVLACDTSELRAISDGPASLIVADFDCTPSYMNRALLDLASTTPLPAGTGRVGSSTAPSFQSPSSSTAPPSVLYWTCRDVRHPLSLRNERAAMKLLISTVTEALEAYPTTLAQDVLDLTDSVAYPQFSNRRHAKVQVRGEKEVLHHFLTWAITALDVMGVIEAELRAERNIWGSEIGSIRADDLATRHQTRGFDAVIRALEEDEDEDDNVRSACGGRSVHHTIVRYCSDVLGSLRREEMKNQRRAGMMIGPGKGDGDAESRLP